MSYRDMYSSRLERAWRDTKLPGGFQVSNVGWRTVAVLGPDSMLLLTAPDQHGSNTTMHIARLVLDPVEETRPTLIREPGGYWFLRKHDEYDEGSLLTGRAIVYNDWSVYNGIEMDWYDGSDRSIVRLINRRRRRLNRALRTGSYIAGLAHECPEDLSAAHLLEHELKGEVCPRECVLRAESRWREPPEIIRIRDEDAMARVDARWESDYGWRPSSPVAQPGETAQVVNAGQNVNLVNVLV